MAHRKTASSPQSSLNDIYIALGSNLGEPLENLREGARRLQSLTDVPLRLSRPWITTPVDCPVGAPPFANAALHFVSSGTLSPEELLQHCQSIEKALGRRPKFVINEARPLDLDIIAFGHEVHNTQTLILPHPRAHKRFFVLAPLTELCPALLLPGHTKTVSQYLETCEPDSSARLVESFDWRV